MKLQLVRTSDGSYTILLPELNEQYHSMNGAITESNHVFVKNGFQFFPGKNPKIFEVGFGTGLNVLLTALASKKEGKKTTYYSIEKYPLEKIWIKQLNYGQMISKEAIDLFHKIHDCEWNKTVKISGNFYLQKIEQDIMNFNLNSIEDFDIVYFDAFGPDKQSEIWNLALFQNLYKKLSVNGVFVTYSAKGEVRRNLAACGFEMQRLPGPPGKKEMLRGIKKE